MNTCPPRILVKQPSTLVQYPSPSYVSQEVGNTNCSIEIPSDSNNNSNPHVDSSDDYFTISQHTLSNLLHTTNNVINNSLSISEVLNALRTDVTTGIRGDDRDLDLRRQAFGSNFQDYSSIDEAQEFKKLIIEALKDTTIILLFCCATLSLVIGIKMNGLIEGLFDGVIIFVSILIVVNCGFLCRYFKARLMRIKNLSRSKNSLIKIIRGGELQHVQLGAIVVGDILCLVSGDNVPVPADGVIIEGDNSLEIDDGEVHKLAFVNYNSKCFSVFTGAKVVAGSCRILVTSVGKNTESSKMMRSIIISDESKLVRSIKKITSKLERISLWLSLLVLVVQLLRCFISKSKYCDEDRDDPNLKDVKNVVEEIMSESTKSIKREGTFRFKGMVAMLCVLLFAIRDGLPIGLFILLAYAPKKIMKIYQTLVQNLPACATSGLVNAICVGETDDLILHHRNMAEFWIGVEKINQVDTAVIRHELLNEIHEAINCMKDDNLGYVEDSLNWWADKFFSKCYDTDELDVRKYSTFVYNKSYKNESDVLLMEKKEVGNGRVHIYCKGLPHIVISMCSQFYHADGTMQILDHQKRAFFNKILGRISSNNLSCFAFAYKHIVPKETEESLGDEPEEFAEDGFTLLCLVGLKNPISAKCREAIKECKESEIDIKLLVPDDIKTARLIAIDSGFITPDQEQIIEGQVSVIEASEFRNSSDEDRMNMIDNIHVMANTTPSDKLLMVQCLKQKGKIVAATGMSIRDSSLMKESDVGFFLGNCASEKAKENADIILLDKNLVTLLGIIKLGRYVHINVIKFIQLQLIFNISAFTINFISVMSGNVEPLTPFELLWENLLLNVFGALALAVSMVRLNSSLSVHESSDIITKTMWRKILVQCMYQITCTLLINMKGRDILNVDDDVLRVMIFNCFVVCQVFLLSGARVMDKTFFTDGKNVCMFCVYVGAIFMVQIVVIEILVVMFSAKRGLDMKQWSICLGIGAVSLFIEGALKWGLPDHV